jgi:serine protease
VRTCVAPATGVDQLQCYCTTSLCGAGMLDAGAAVAAAGALAGSAVDASFSPADPIAGETINFRISGWVGSTPSASIVAQSWQLLDGGGAAVGFSSATNADTAALPTSAAGTLRVRLSVTDSAGVTVSEDTAIVVRSSTSSGGGSGGGSSGSGGGGGGGGTSGAWVAGVALAAFVLRALNRRP